MATLAAPGVARAEQDMPFFAASPKPEIELLYESQDASGKRYLYRTHPHDQHILQCFYDLEVWGPRRSCVAEVLIVDKDGDHGFRLEGFKAAVIYKGAPADQVPTCLVFVGAHAPQAYVAERTYLVKGDPIPFAEGSIVLRTLNPLRWTPK